MMEAPIPADERERLAAVHALRLLDTPAEERFDRITRTARDLFQVPIALITLVDAKRQWFKSRLGLAATETSRAISFCGHAIAGDGIFLVENAGEDARFADNPLVVGPPHIRFYAGMPLLSSGGKKLGTLCLLAPEPRRFNAAERARLRDLAAWAELELNLALEKESGVAEMRQSFVRLVSHELRTPATSLLGAIDLLVEMGAAGEPGKEAGTLARIAGEGAGRLKRIVDDIVVFAELDAGEVNLSTRRIDVTRFLADIVNGFAASAQRAEVRIAMALPPGLVFEGAAQPLQKIIECLLDNAVRFSPAGGEVRLAAELRGQALRVAVEDAGPGLEEGDLPRLFQPFAQVDSSDRRRRGGLGLGLSLARRLAVAMGGRLGYEARPCGGSRFFVELP